MSAYEIGFVRKGSFAAVQARHLAYLQANNPKNAAIPGHTRPGSDFLYSTGEEAAFSVLIMDERAKVGSNSSGYMRPKALTGEPSFAEVFSGRAKKKKRRPRSISTLARFSTISPWLASNHSLCRRSSPGLSGPQASSPKPLSLMPAMRAKSFSEGTAILLEKYSALCHRRDCPV